MAIGSGGAARVVGKVVAKLIGEYDDRATSAIEKSERRMKMAFKGMQIAAAAVAIAVIGIGTASLKMAMEFNKSMANVATLIPGNIERVKELKREVQNLAIETGKSTQDLAEGLYQVESAFGDTKDTVDILTISAKAATAGVAETVDAINLISAVTKGYGDTSKEAAQKAADLAFQTVKLGQTTFPELAASIGKVVPLANALGVEQEILFAQMATLTGVTGNAAEVSTQLRATYQALLKPTADMAMAIGRVSAELDAQGKLVDGPLVKAWREAKAAHDANYVAMLKLEKAGKANTHQYKALLRAGKELKKGYEDASAALGPAIVQSVGYTDALKMLAGVADGNTNVLGKMFGSVEALNAVLALTGAQAGTFTEKLAAMRNATGALNEAYTEQTEGVNKLGHMWEQTKQRGVVMMQSIGDMMIPILTQLLEELTPAINAFMEWLRAISEDEEAIKSIATFISEDLIGSIKAVIEAFQKLDEMVGIVTRVGPVLEWIATFMGFPIDIMRAIVNAKSVMTTFLSWLENIWDATIGRMINTAKSLWNVLNPNTGNSPSPVENWMHGIAAMRAEFASFADFVARPMQPSLQYSYVGAGVGYSGGSSGSVSTTSVRNVTNNITVPVAGAGVADRHRTAQTIKGAIDRLERRGI